MRWVLAAVALCWALPAAGQAGFRWVEEKGALRLTYRGRPLLQYNCELVPPPKGVSQAFARNAYLHPVWNTAGQIVTGDFPRDHRHQRGIFLAWTKTQFGNLHPDFWNLGSLTGRVRFEAVEEKDAGESQATLLVRHIWQAREGQRWIPVLRERWRIVVYPPPPGASWWYMDLTSEQQLVGQTPLVLPQYRYGGMAYRGSNEWIDNPQTVVVLTSEGKGRQEADNSTARWCLMGGALGEGWGGATLMDHPQNPRFPNRLRVHPKVPYFGFMLPKSGQFVIRPGETLVLRYRIVVHSAQPKSAELDRLWEQFSRKPQGQR